MESLKLSTKKYCPFAVTQHIHISYAFMLYLAEALYLYVDTFHILGLGQRRKYEMKQILQHSDTVIFACFKNSK
jgi:hypothetical protein